ncbi:MAG: T9SS type A sorting domain-containing protein [Chloroherpetonaceae bacterium]|nr:T9SS type A sorting domain-containing protein [Chloroherpetonaceae bacterium]MDW8019811.1 T9SS type A sorting domain-containing protein [Chloroherpetonaceae bacterium]
MQRKSVWLSLTLLLLLLPVVVYVVHEYPQWLVPAKTDREQEREEQDRYENPQARYEWELMQLVDPHTGKLPKNIRQKELAYANTLPSDAELVERFSLSRIGQFQTAPPERTKSLSALQTVQWMFRGPVNVGGRTRAMAIDVSNENVILAGGVSGGMWRSEDGGRTWRKTTSPDDLHSVSCLVQDTRPGRRNVWYYGTGELRGNSASSNIGGGLYRGDGIFKSVDGGRTWARLPSTVTNAPQVFDNYFDWVWNVAIDPSNLNEDEVYAATLGAIHRSIDGGNSWRVVLPQGGNFSNATISPRFTDVAVTSTGVVYAAMSSATSDANVTVAQGRGIWRSTDGINWTNITPPNFPETYNRFVIGISPSNENVVYFLGETPNSGFNGAERDWTSLWRYTYLSGNGAGAGGRWENLSQNLPNFGGPVGNMNSQQSYNLVVKVKPDNPNVVFIGGTNLYRSTDGFTSPNNTTWIGGYATTNDVRLYPNHHCDQHVIAFLPSNPNVMLTANDGGVQRTNNCLAAQVVWENLSRGYITSQFYTVAIDQSSTSNVIIGGLQDNGTYFVNSTTVDTDWRSIAGGDGGYCAIAIGGNPCFASFQEGRILRLSLASDGRVLASTNITPSGASNPLFINPFALDPNNSEILYSLGGDRIFRTTRALTVTSTSGWDTLSPPFAGARLTTLSVSRQPANRLYYGTNTGRVFRVDDAHTATPTTTEITGANFPRNASGATVGYVSSIAIDPNDADKVLVALSNYNIQSLYYTENGGISWTAVGGNLEENPDGTGSGPAVKWVDILPVQGGAVYFAGTTTGLYATTRLNGMQTQWVQQGRNLIGNVVVDMIRSRQTDGLVVVATHGAGVYSTNITSLAPLSAQTDAPVAKSFRLMQNYPNPFNPSTTIQYQLPIAANVVLKVYDALGREVATLVNERKPAGLHQVEFRPVNLASGTYFYRLQAGSYSETKKMMLIK